MFTETVTGVIWISNSLTFCIIAMAAQEKLIERGAAAVSVIAAVLGITLLILGA